MYEDIRLEKSLYNVNGKTFTQALTELDPDENYASTELAGLDAFERQLKRFDIKVSGKDCDRVEKFFVSTQSALLFPEFIRRSIKQGLDECSILDDITAAKGYTDGIDFRGITVSKAGSEETQQGAQLSATSVALAGEATAAKKYARKLSVTYEAVRKQRIEALAVVLRSLGADIARAVDLEAVNTLAKGAASSNMAGAKVTYADLAAFWSKLSGYDMTTIVTTPAIMADILALDEMKYCVSDFMTSGKVKTPYGVTIIKCAGMETEQMVGIDSKNALEAVFATDVCIDSDRLLSTQCEEISCSVMVGFSKIATDAAAVMKPAE